MFFSCFKSEADDEQGLEKPSRSTQKCVKSKICVTLTLPDVALLCLKCDFSTFVSVWAVLDRMSTFSSEAGLAQNAVKM